jgi:hypothetical protein
MQTVIGLLALLFDRLISCGYLLLCMFGGNCGIVGYLLTYYGLIVVVVEGLCLVGCRLIIRQMWASAAYPD